MNLGLSGPSATKVVRRMDFVERLKAGGPSCSSIHDAARQMASFQIVPRGVASLRWLAKD